MPRWDENGRPIPDAPVRRWDANGKPLKDRPLTQAEQAALDYTRRIAEVSAMAARRPSPPRVRPAETRGRQRAATRGQALYEDAQQVQGSGVLQGIAGVGDALAYASGGAPGLASAGILPSQLLNATGLSYVPQTTEGEYAQTIASMAPGAIAPGSAARKVASTVIPGLTSETAGQIARNMGYDEGSEAWWRIVGALGGGVVSGLGGARPAAPPRVPSAVQSGEAAANVNLSSAAAERVAGFVRRGKRPDQAARLAAAQDMPVPIPLRRGDLTRNPTDQIRENMALRGAYGEKAAAQMQGIVATQREALRGNVDAIAENIGAGARRPLREGGTPAAETLDAMRQRADQFVNSAYAAARDSGEGAMLHRDMGITARSRLLEGLAGPGYRPDTAPVTYRIVDELTTTGRPIPLADVFTARQQLTALRPGGGIEGAAAGSAVRALDGFIQEAVDTGAVYGDPQAIDLWRQAIRANAKKAELFQGNDLIETLTERTARNGDRRVLAVDPREAADAIFGVGNGLGRRANQVRDLERMRSVLGEGPEWNAIRAEHFQRLASRADGGMEGGVRQFSGANLNKSWQDFLRDNRALADTLYTPEEQRQISTFASLAADITSPVRGGDNPPSTAAALLSLVPQFIKSVPFLGRFIDNIGKDMTGNAVVRNAINPTPQAAPYQVPRLPAPPPAAVTAGIIGGTTAEQQNSRRRPRR